MEKYRTTGAGGGSYKWTWTPTKQLGQASDAPENVPFGSVTAGNVMREHLGHLHGEGFIAPLCFVIPFSCGKYSINCVRNSLALILVVKI